MMFWLTGRSSSGVRLAPSLMAFAAAGVISLNGPSPAKAETTLERIKKEGIVTMGMANEPPWTQVKPDGSVAGAGPDLVKAVLSKLGVKEIKGELLEYGAMIPALQTGRIDIITTGALFMTPQRCEAILFSLPDICDGEGFAIKAGNPLGLKSFADVKNTGAKVGVCAGCTEEKHAREAGVPDENITIVPDGQSGIKMLRDGRIDVYVLPATSITDLVAKADDPSIEKFLPVEGIPVSCTGAGFRKEDAEFRTAYDQAFQELKTSGEYATILQSYNFPADLEASTSRETLCDGAN